MKQFLDKLSGHTRLNTVEQNAILALEGTVLVIASEAAVTPHGHHADTCCLVVEGLLSRVGHTADGRRQIEAFYVPGDMANIEILVMPMAHASLQTLCASRILLVSRTALKDLMLRYPAVAEALWRETVVGARISSEWILNIGQRPARERIAHLICEIAQRVVETRSEIFDFEFPVTQGQLGEATGISTVHVNRVLQSLRGQKLIRVSSHRVEILDWAGLKTVAGFDPSYLTPAPQRLAPA